MVKPRRGTRLGSASLALLTLMAVSCSTPVPNEDVIIPPPEASRAEMKAPNNSWEPIYFKAINERARIANLGDLRSVTLTGSDLEVRVWVGFGLVPLEGIIVKRNNGTWSATHLRSVDPRLPRHRYQQALPPPKSGWENFWERLTSEGVLTLPDDSQLEDKVRATDGQSFVVEINTDKSYRTYRYSNPHLQKWPEARRMTNIANIIFQEFNIDRTLIN